MPICIYRKPASAGCRACRRCCLRLRRCRARSSSRGFGMVAALLAGLLLTAAGSAARGAVADAAFLYASTIAMGAGVAIVQTVMPPLVRSWFPQRIGLATTIYTNGLLIGEILPVGLTIPLILPLLRDSWRLDLVLWSLPVLATAAVRCALRAGRRHSERRRSARQAAMVARLAKRDHLAAWVDPRQRQFDLLRQQRVSSRLRHRARPSGPCQQRADGDQCRPAARNVLVAGVCRPAAAGGPGPIGSRAWRRFYASSA